MKLNDFEILGLNEGATKEEIKKAYRENAKKYHPDVNSDNNAAALFKIINQAYENLLKEDAILDEEFKSNNEKNDFSFNDKPYTAEYLKVRLKITRIDETMKGIQQEIKETRKYHDYSYFIKGYFNPIVFFVLFILSIYGLSHVTFREFYDTYYNYDRTIEYRQENDKTFSLDSKDSEIELALGTPLQYNQSSKDPNIIYVRFYGCYLTYDLNSGERISFELDVKSTENSNGHAVIDSCSAKYIEKGR